MTDEVIKVGISDIKVAFAPKKLRTSGLGSCVGVIIYNLTDKAAVMAHVMLPDNMTKTSNVHPGKYANTAIEAMLVELRNYIGQTHHHFQAKIAGGAEMFKHSNSTSLFRIGPRNVEVIKQELAKFKIPIVAEDTGGNKGRSIEFEPSTGLLTIRTVTIGTRTI